MEARQFHIQNLSKDSEFYFIFLNKVSSDAKCERLLKHINLGQHIIPPECLLTEKDIFILNIKMTLVKQISALVSPQNTRYFQSMNDKAGFESERDGNLAPFPSFTKRRLLLASLLHSLGASKVAQW